MPDIGKKNHRFLDAHNSSIPEGYHMSPGWTHEVHGCTWDAWYDELKDFVERMEDNDKKVPERLVDFHKWQEYWLEEASEDRDSLGFSCSRCELCGSLPGDRHAMSAIPEDPAKDILQYEVCDACLMYVANSELPFETDE